MIARKLPKYAKFVDQFLARFDYELIDCGSIKDTTMICDPKDQPILDIAIKGNLDVIITGDKDFLSLNLKRPKCLTPTEFLQEEKVN